MFARRGMLVSLLFSSPVAAQTVADLRGCGVAAESTTAVLVMRVRPRPGAPALPRELTDAFARQAASGVDWALALPLDGLAAAGPQGARWLVRGTSATYAAEVLPDTSTVVRTLSPSSSGVLDGLALASLGRAAFLLRRQMPSIPWPSGAVALRVELTTTDSAREGWVEAHRFATTRVPLERLPASIRGTPPRFPEALRRADVEGEATLDFVVRADGRADSASARVVDATEPEFAFSALAALPTMHFRPARVHGCPVPLKVRQSFRFRLGG